MIKPGFSASAMALRIFATASGSTAPSAFTRMPRSAPMASAVRIVSAACAGPTEMQTISVALPASLSRIASSTAISSNGFIDILTLPSSTPEPSGLTRIFTSLSIARFTGTRIFMRGTAAVVTVFRANRRGHKRAAAVRQTTGQGAAGQRFLAVFAWLPEHVARPLAIGVTAGDEKVIGQAVEVFQHFRGDHLPGFVLQLGGESLGAPANGAREVQIGRSSAAAGQHKGS